jgi:type III secretion protein J
VNVVTDVSNTDADRVVAALESRGIGADKAKDTNGGRFRVAVPSDDAARAVSALLEDRLPGAPPEHARSALTEALVPSPAAEHTRAMTETGSAIERTLEDADGVLSARVLLAVPRADPLAEQAEAPATASVLIRHRSPQSPISTENVQRLVAAAVPGLAPKNVVVVMLPATTPARADLAHVGPLTGTRASARRARLVVGAILVVNVALVAGVLALWAKLRLRRGQTAPAPTRSDP